MRLVARFSVYISFVILTSFMVDAWRALSTRGHVGVMRTNLIYPHHIISNTCSIRGRSFALKAESSTVDTNAPPEKVSEIKIKLQADMKDAMKAKQKSRLAGIRAIQTAIKQKEVDERIIVDDVEAIAIMTKLMKQRKESIKSYADSGRQDLVEVEEEELKVILSYMPEQMSSEAVEKLIDETISKLEATTIKDMGKVMAVLRPALAGKADTSVVGDLLKKKLSGK